MLNAKTRPPLDLGVEPCVPFPAGEHGERVPGGCGDVVESAEHLPMDAGGGALGSERASETLKDGTQAGATRRSQVHEFVEHL